MINSNNGNKPPVKNNKTMILGIILAIVVVGVILSFVLVK